MLFIISPSVCYDVIFLLSFMYLHYFDIFKYLKHSIRYEVMVKLVNLSEYLFLLIKLE